MATTEHASNEQMAEIMGWHLSGGYWVDAQGKWVDEYVNTIGSGCEYWNPIDNLNHAALVEARLAELELDTYYTHHLKLLILQQKGICNEYDIATAKAQTRCDATWATWQQYQKDKE